MASWFVSLIQNIRPFGNKNFDDLKVSEGIVRALPLADSSKQFVFALPVPGQSSVVYLLASEKLSQKSAVDACTLIEAVRPKTVIAQIDPSSIDEIREEEQNLCGEQAFSVPTSWFGVLKGCFLERINWRRYEKVAGSQVLQTIFGTGFYGPILAAKQAAEKSQSLFLYVENPRQFCKNVETESNYQPGKAMNKIVRGDLSHSLLANLKNGSAFSIEGNFVKQRLRSILSLSMDRGSSPPSAVTCDLDSDVCDPIPSFAEPFYPLLVDLHAVFSDLPAVRTALAFARRLLVDVEKDREVGYEILSEVNKFRFAVEGLRIVLNSNSRSPLTKEGKNVRTLNLDDLSHEDACDAILAHSLKTQARKCGTLVAIVNPSSIAGIRKYWNASLSPEIVELAEECFISDQDNDSDSGNSTSGKRLVDKPVVAVGAGAATVIGVSSFSKMVPASSIVKVATLKIPSVINLGLMQTKRLAAGAIGKFLGPTKFLVPAYKGAVPGKMTASYAIHSPSTAKLAVSAEKFRAAAHSIVASAERSSLSAIRTSFYGIMRKRQGKASGPASWMTLGFSVLACTGLVTYGDGIECAAESAPAMHSIARLGRGLEKLRQASEHLKQIGSGNVLEAIHSSLHNSKIGK